MRLSFSELACFTRISMQVPSAGSQWCPSTPPGGSTRRDLRSDVSEPRLIQDGLTHHATRAQDRRTMTMAKAVPLPPSISLGDVAAQPGQQLRKLIEVALAQPGAQSLVEGHRGVAQAEEEDIALGGELHYVDAAVRRIPVPGHQAGRLHRVQVVGGGGALDTDRAGELAGAA